MTPIFQSLACWINKKERAWGHVMPSVGWKLSSAMAHASSDLSDHTNAPIFPSSSTQSGRTNKHGKMQECGSLDSIYFNWHICYISSNMKSQVEGEGSIVRCRHTVLLITLNLTYTCYLSIWKLQQPYDEHKDKLIGNLLYEFMNREKTDNIDDLIYSFWKIWEN